LKLQVEFSNQGTTNKVSTCFSSTKSDVAPAKGKRKTAGKKKNGTTKGAIDAGIDTGTCVEIGADGSVGLIVYKGGEAEIKLSKTFQVETSAQVGANLTYSPDGTLHLSVYAKTSAEFTVLGSFKMEWSSSVTIDVVKMSSSLEALFTLSWLEVEISLCIGGYCLALDLLGAAGLGAGAAILAGFGKYAYGKRAYQQGSADGWTLEGSAVAHQNAL
jgi:hypothetical protein